MAMTLGNLAVGSIVKLNENGVPAEYLIVHQGNPDGYNSSCDGTWLLRKDVSLYPIKWDESNCYYYHKSYIDRVLVNTYLHKFDDRIIESLLPAKLPDISTSQVPEGRKIFLLSEIEIVENPLVNAGGTTLSYFKRAELSKKVAYFDGSAVSWWTRTYEGIRSSAVQIDEAGNSNNYNSYWSENAGLRPAVILSSSLFVSDDGFVITNIAPSTPTTITLPSTVYGGKSCSVSWSKSTDEDGNLEGYIVERSYNGGSSWSQIYQGTATSTSTTIPFGTSTVMFRVCAYDTEGEKSGWRTSSNKTVINNRAPSAPPSISVPLAPSGGEALTVTWTAASDADDNLEGYELERQWDGTGAFTQLYKGAALSYRDSIPKGEHTSVIYRVRSYDAMGAKSSYTTSPSRTIENNTAPVITSDLSGDLGVKSDGFTIPYTITDAEQQAVTVTEAVGSLIKRSYQPTLGEQNTFEVTGEYFQKILNGANTVTITAQDTGGKSSVLSLTFTKKVHKAVITLTEPLPSEQQIEVCVLSITGEIPADADCLIEVTNNGADEEPVWEDATADVKAGRNHVFTNKTQTNGWAFNFRVTAERGQDGESENGGYIMSIQGGFQ